MFLLAFLPRCLLAFIYPHETRYLDEKGCLDLATSLLKDGTYELNWEDPVFTNQFTALAYPPLTPFFIAGIQAVFGSNLLFVKLGFAMVAGLSAILLFKITEHLFGKPPAWAATIIYAFYPLILYLNNTFFPQTVGTAFLLGLILFILKSKVADGKMLLHSSGCGIALGLLILTIPAFAPLSPLFALWLMSCLRSGRAPWLKALGGAGIMTFAACLIVLPWTYRNYLRHQDFFLVTGGIAVPFWEGNLKEYPNYFVETLKPMTPKQRERFLFEQAWARIKQQRAVVLGRIASKFASFFALWGEQMTQTKYSAPFYKAISAFTYGPVLLLALWGLPRLIRYNGQTAWLMAVALGVAVLYAVFLIKVRYRLVLDPLLIALAAATVFCRRSKPLNSSF